MPRFIGRFLPGYIEIYSCNWVKSVETKFNQQELYDALYLYKVEITD